MAAKYIDPMWSIRGRAIPKERLADLARKVARIGQGWPSLCAVCHGWGGQRVCADCLQRFAARVPRCTRCALQAPPGISVCGACLAAPPPFERSVAAVDYAYPWDGLITRFKFHGALDLAPALTRCLAHAVADHSGRSALSLSTLPSLLLPVPLSASRLRERGYNQAWELTRRLARLRACQADARLLLRVKDTAHQLALPPAQRTGNVRGAFAIEPTRRAELQNRSVALIDDVMTTGATAAEITRVLLQAGAARVEVWAVARTPRPADG